MRKWIRIWYIMLVAIMVSCSKGDKSNPLTGNVWKFTMVDIFPELNGSDSFSIYSPPACQLDDRYFITAISFTTDKGTQLCMDDTETASTTTKPCSIGDKTITINGVSYDIIALTTLVLKLSATNYPVGSRRMLFVYEKAD